MLLSDYVQAVRRGWIIILVTLLLALAGAGFLVARKADIYTSSTQLFVAAAAPSADPEELYQRNLIAAQRVKSYVSLALGDVVASRVAEVIGSDIEGSVSVSVLPETVILQISVSGADPDRVAEEAGAYAEVLPAVIDEVDSVDDSATQVRVTVIDKADVPSAPIPSSPGTLFVAAAILGLGLGFTIVMVREVLRRETTDRAPDADVPPA